MSAMDEHKRLLETHAPPSVMKQWLLRNRAGLATDHRRIAILHSHLNALCENAFDCSLESLELARLHRLATASLKEAKRMRRIRKDGCVDRQSIVMGLIFPENRKTARKVLLAWKEYTFAQRHGRSAQDRHYWQAYCRRRRAVDSAQEAHISARSIFTTPSNMDVAGIGNATGTAHLDLSLGEALVALAQSYPNSVPMHNVRASSCIESSAASDETMVAGDESDISSAFRSVLRSEVR